MSSDTPPCWPAQRRKQGEEMSVSTHLYPRVYNYNNRCSATQKHKHAELAEARGSIYNLLESTYSLDTPSETNSWMGSRDKGHAVRQYTRDRHLQFPHGHGQTSQALMRTLSPSDRGASQNKHQPGSGQTGPQSQRSCNLDLEIRGFNWEEWRGHVTGPWCYFILPEPCLFRQDRKWTSMTQWKVCTAGGGGVSSGLPVLGWLASSKFLDLSELHFFPLCDGNTENTSSHRDFRIMQHMVSHDFFVVSLLIIWLLKKEGFLKVLAELTHGG